MSAFIVLFIAICLFGILQRSGVGSTRDGRAQSRWSATSELPPVALTG